MIHPAFILRSPVPSPFETALARLLRMKGQGVSKDEGLAARQK